MRHAIVSVFLLCAAATNMAAAQEKVAAMTDKERIDSLVKQNQMLLEEIARLTVQASRPRTREEAFVQCMQAAKGQTSAMATESIGSHCDQLLKQKPSDAVEPR